MWTFRFHSGLSAFSSSDINKIVSILSNAASASKIYWNNNICIKCTHLPFTEITVFQIFSIQILKLISDTMELFRVIYGNEEQDGSKLQNVKHSSSQNNSRTLLLQQRVFVKEPDTWCFYLQLLLHETRRIAPISPVSFCQER